MPIRHCPAQTRQADGARRFGIGSFHSGGIRDFELIFVQAVPNLIEAPDIVLQLRPFKRNEITATLAGNWRFVVRPWHRVLIFMAGSRTGRIGAEKPVALSACGHQGPANYVGLRRPA